uniref:Uncharacterized protein n=1 Tax=Panagrolaimus superbus TaxID=310955 RepID=A0A914YBY9_9BILA
MNPNVRLQTLLLNMIIEKLDNLSDHIGDMENQVGSFQRFVDVLNTRVDALEKGSAEMLSQESIFAEKDNTKEENVLEKESDSSKNSFGAKTSPILDQNYNTQKEEGSKNPKDYAPDVSYVPVPLPDKADVVTRGESEPASFKDSNNTTQTDLFGTTPVAPADAFSAKSDDAQRIESKLAGTKSFGLLRPAPRTVFGSDSDEPKRYIKRWRD